MDFNEYFDQNHIEAQKYYCAFRGIKRKDFPKWAGWNYIDGLKGTTAVSDIDDELINLLVENFYLVQFIRATYYDDSLV